MVEQQLINMLPNLGVGVAAMVVLYLSFRDFLKTLNEKEKVFKNYVEANNHKSVEVMTECRDVMSAAAENIKKNTEVMQSVTQALIKRQ